MIKLNNCFWIPGLVTLCFLGKINLAKAQITADETLSTQVITTNNLNFIINKGNRSGNNLFHSFSEFSIPTGGSASFANDMDVKNIFSRVTGVSSSHIDGLLKTNGSANLFLINPNGIIFGSGASLKINGSFIASTASHLLFADGSQFSATNPQTPPLLTVSVPIGLQFGQTAQPIQIDRAKLEVTTDKTLAMLAGDVLINGGELIAPAGRIDIGSVASNSLVNLTTTAEGWALRYEGVLNLQDIKLLQTAISTTGEGHGAIQLRGREIAIADRSQVGGWTMGAKAGQPLEIAASESLEVSDRSQLRTLALGTGAAGDIIIKTRRLIVRNGGYINASTYSPGSGGNLIVHASESVEILGDGFLTTLGTQTFDLPNNIGNAGIVQIFTRRLILRDGGQISTSTFGGGNGGTLRINASESVEASGRVLDNGINTANEPSGLFTESLTVGNVVATGNGGDLIINTQRLVVQGGASISVAATNSAGQAGRLDINASDSVMLIGTGINAKGQAVPSTLLAASNGSGSAGNLRINTGNFTIRDGAEVSVSNTGSGITGDLQITANNLLLDEGKLTAETTGGQGNINLNSRNLILRRGSQITTEAEGNNITGSNITINTDVLAALENSDISANSRDARGGNVTINSSAIFGTQLRTQNTPNSDITATGENSQNGIVQINTPDVDPSSGLIELPVNLVDFTQLIAQGCPGNRGNSFIITGRGGLPPSPNELLRPNNTVSVNWVTGESSSRGLREQRTPGAEEQIVEATGWIINDKGQVELIASASTPTPNSNRFNPPSCPE
jgi:filamentous hemagglutinin family protein